jgi:hypothetical protein
LGPRGAMGARAGTQNFARKIEKSGQQGGRQLKPRLVQ